MALRLGQVAFGTVGGGIVAAAGLAACLASAQGKIEVRKHASGSPAVAAAQIQGKAYRTRKVPVLAAQANASAQGRIKANCYVSGLAQAVATAYGRGTAEFSGYGEANATYTFAASPYRIARTRGQVARGTAALSGEAYLYQILHGKPAEATATLYGTTYHLAYGTAACTASATAQLHWRAGVTAEAMATAVAEGTAQYTMTLWPAIAEPQAVVRAEDAVTIDGVRYLEVFGEAVVEAIAENTHMAIYPSVTALVSAQAQARAKYTFGAKGHAQGVCSLFGSMIAATTAVTLVQGDSVSSATGRIRALHRFKGHAQVSASGNGVPLVTETGVVGQGIVQATGSGTVLVRNTKVYPDDAYGVAALSGRFNRVRSVSGSGANMYSYAQGQMQRIHIAYGVALATANLAGKQFRTRLFGGAAHAAVTADVLNMQLEFAVAPAEASVVFTGQIQREQFVSGEALGVAMSNVGIQVNDAARAPVSRTVVVLTESRTAFVAEESRTIVV